MDKPAEKRRAIFSTISNDHVGFWVEQVSVFRQKDAPQLSQWFRKVWPKAKASDAVILRGTVGFKDMYRDLLLAAALRRNPRYNGRIVISDATIEPGSRELVAKFPGFLRPIISIATQALSRALIAAVDGPQVTWCVLSHSECEIFPRTWGVNPERVSFTAFPHTLWDAQGPNRKTTTGDYFFSGGNSLRDYDLLLQAVRMTNIPTVVASTTWRPQDVPPALTATSCSHEEFLNLMANARAVVIPLAESSRSAGQQTYLNSMALGKITVVNDALGVGDYVIDGHNGLVSGPGPEGLAASMRRADALVGSSEGDRIVQHARSVASSHTTETYLESLLRIAKTRQ